MQRVDMEMSKLRPSCGCIDVSDPFEAGRKDEKFDMVTISSVNIISCLPRRSLPLFSKIDRFKIMGHIRFLRM